MNAKSTLRFIEVLDELEKQRKFIKLIIILSFIPLIFTFAVVFSREYRDYSTFVMRFTFIIFMGLIIFAGNKKKIYSKQFKRYIIEYGINQYFDDVKYQPDYGIDSSTVYSAGMVLKGNHFESEDLITGVFKGVPFTQSDVRIQRRQGPSRYAKRIDLFCGRWMIFNFNKNFVCNLQVVEKGFFGSKKGKDQYGSRLHKLEMDDEAFNRAFKVNCEDNEEAYYILTPQMMRRMLELKENTKGQLMFCFMNNALHIACNTGRNSFEPPVFNKIDLQKIMNDTYSDLSLITSFVDSLNLDNRLFTDKGV
jgi:hypothetical protein